MIQSDLTFSKEGHSYTWKGKVVPSATTILGRVGCRVKTESGEFWRSVSHAEMFEGNEAAENAANLGTALHAYAALRLVGKDADYDPALQPWVDLWELAYKTELRAYTTLVHKGVPLIEEPLYCAEQGGYAGTPDWVVEHNLLGVIHGRYVVDWKTGAYCDHWWLQMGAYCHGVEKLLGPARKVGAIIVQIDPMHNTVPRVYIRKAVDMQTYWWKFSALLTTYHMF